jgi:flagellar biosynthesis/type III secretory pathway chaperone
MTTTTTAGLVSDLLDALARETDLCRDLLAVLERERACLVAASQTGLLRAVQEKESALERIRTQARDVERAMKALAEPLGLSGREWIPLSRLAGFLEEPARARVLKAQAGLAAFAETADESNRMNDRLIHRSLAYVAQSLTMMRAFTSGSVSYSPTGAAGEPKQSGRLVTLKG